MRGWGPIPRLPRTCLTEDTEWLGACVVTRAGDGVSGEAAPGTQLLFTKTL